VPVRRTNAACVADNCYLFLTTDPIMDLALPTGCDSLDLVHVRFRYRRIDSVVEG
jgi:hypothetical protein